MNAPAGPVEIEFDLKLRGDLSATLDEEAKRRGEPPAELLADLIETLLKKRRFDILDQEPPAVAPPKPRDRSGYHVYLGENVVEVLAKEAQQRGMGSGKALAEVLLTMIALDKLFVALLDN